MTGCIRRFPANIYFKFQIRLYSILALSPLMHTHVQNPTHSFSDFCKQQDKYEKDSLEASRLNQYYVQTA